MMLSNLIRFSLFSPKAPILHSLGIIQSPQWVSKGLISSTANSNKLSTARVQDGRGGQMTKYKLRMNNLPSLWYVGQEIGLERKTQDIKIPIHFLFHLATLIQDAVTFANRCRMPQNSSLSNQLETIKKERRKLRGSDKLARRIAFPGNEEEDEEEVDKETQ
jgi:hypothetical protein